MRAHAFSLALAGSLAMFTLAPDETDQSGGLTASRAAEIARIRAHFDSVLAELSQRDVSRLTSTQRTHRDRLLGTLKAYRDRGAFPHNYDFPGRAVPYFVDRKTGVLCAVAYLLESTGRRDIVDRVAAGNNNVWVPELATDTAFTAWLDGVGLTIDEAARIQVPYDDGGNSSPYVTATVPVGALSIATSVLNATSNRSGKNGVISRLGVVSGVLGLGLSVLGPMASDLDIPNALVVTNATLGMTSFVLGIHAVTNHNQSKKLQHVARARDIRESQDRFQASVAPIVITTGGQHAPGVSVNIRF
jgi:hypothetical protein